LHLPTRVCGCQTGDVEVVWDFNSGGGQHGNGIYAFMYGDKAMTDYYCKNGESLHTFKVPREYVVNLSQKNWDLWDAKAYIYNNPQYKVFIFKHQGAGIPTSKEVLITDPSIIQLID